MWKIDDVSVSHNYFFSLKSEGTSTVICIASQVAAILIEFKVSEKFVEVIYENISEYITRSHFSKNNLT